MKKVPFTQGAQLLVIRKLIKLHDDGLDANAHLEKAIECGWRTVYPDEKMKIKRETPAGPYKDPALQKIEEDSKKAGKMPEYVRQLQARIRT